MAKLTNNRDVHFEICFKYPLQSRYTFSDLERHDVKAFQRFLDKVSRMTVGQVDRQFARKPNHSDIFNGSQVYHYEVSKSFRIRVVNESGYYKVIRLNPHHSFHG
jgi:hypothetical protein